MAVISVVMLTPFAWVLFGSFKSQTDFISNPGALLPSTWTAANYSSLFVDKGFGQYLVNSLIISAVAVVGNIIFSGGAAYALAKLSFRGRGLIFSGVIAAMIVPTVAIFVPQYLVAVQLGLVDSLAGIVAPVLVLPLSVFIMRQYAHSVPDELLEAARIDGANELRTFATVFLPLTGPAMATVGILSFLASWNAFLWPLIVAQSQNTYTLPVGLAAASQASNTTLFGLLLAGAVVVLLPVLILFLFLQRYFIKGVATAGLK